MMDAPWFLALWLLGSYLVGALSVGDLVARAAGVDIRSVGTGNPGAANVWREIGRGPGIAVFALDVAKGAVATAPLQFLHVPAWLPWAATAFLLVGHLYPVFWRFKGGTGMAAAMGVVAGLLPLGIPVGAAAGGLTLLLMRNTGYSGAVFFLGTAISGGLLARDPVGAVGVLLVAVAVRLRALVQYRGRQG